MGPWFRYIASYDLSAAEALTRTLLGAKKNWVGRERHWSGMVGTHLTTVVLVLPSRPRV